MKNEFNFIEVMGRAKKALNIKADYEMAERLGMKATSFNSRKKANSLPYEELLLLANSEKLNMDWLITGEGEMLKGAKVESERFSEEDVRILRMLKRLPEPQKKKEIADIEVFLQSVDEAVSHWVANNQGRHQATMA